MNRLTYINYGKYALRSLNNEEELVADKLGQLEDIEQELNTNFVILGKAKQNGIYIILDDEVKYISPSEMTVYIDHIMLESGKQLYLYEYGKSWTLTKRY